MCLLRFASALLALVILVTLAAPAGAQTYVQTASGGWLVGPDSAPANSTGPTGPLLPGPTPSPTPSGPVSTWSPLSNAPSPTDLTCCLEPIEEELSTIMAVLLSINITRYDEHGIPIASDEPVSPTEIGSVCWSFELDPGAAPTRVEGWVTPRPSPTVSWAFGVFNANQNPFDQFEINGANFECIVRF